MMEVEDNGSHEWGDNTVKTTDTNEQLALGSDSSEGEEQEGEGEEEEEEESEDELNLDDDADDDEDEDDDGRSALLMQFCPQDSSMLYPKEDKTTRTLVYACRRCTFSLPSNKSLVYRNILKKEVKNVLHTVPSAVRDDPTLTRSKDGSNSCTICGCTEAVFFHSDTGQSDSLALIFVCCNPDCGHKWVK